MGAPDQWLARWVIERGLALIYVVAFVVTIRQFAPLNGERGLVPAAVWQRVGFRRSPSLFRLRYSDGLLRAAAAAGAVIAALLLAGLPQRGPVWLPMLAWAVLWALYLSIVNIGVLFYSFGWETLLCEAGFLAIFLGPASMEPPVLVLWLMRWLVFRVEFGAGLIKMRGDRCWRDLTCLRYHHETQPMPNPLSWYFHRLPDGLHRVEVVANHAAQLVVPWFLFAPQPAAGVAAIVIVVTQAWLLLSGNFSWLNLITVVLAVSAMDDAVLDWLIPVAPPELSALAGWYAVVVVVLTVGIAMLSYWPVRNLLSRRQLMNTSFDPLRLVNSYGAFGSITRRRYEVVIEGTADATPDGDSEWREYEFKGKPGDVRRRPPQVAPYHLRLDWLMWFAGLSSRESHPWLGRLMGRLLEGDRATLKLLRTNPFPDVPPVWVRALRYHYRFTTRSERRATKAWWVREPAGTYWPAIRR